MPQITIGRSAGSGPSEQYGISNMPVSFFSDGDDPPSTPKADVMSIPSSSYDQCPASSCSLPSYSYKPLDIGWNEIRLIKLQAPIKSQPLCGNIIHAPLSAKLRYWALSYCWGSLAGKRTIILDGKKLQITVNLDDALRQLGNSYGMLWVDAICINQEDIPERSREVQRMGDIYSLASGVVAWLGVANKTSDRAMDFLQVLATKAPRSQYDEYLKELPSEDGPGKFQDDWIALRDLVKNGYWSRTWIIQEIALCRRIKIVHCGTKSLSWDNFANVFGDSNFGDSIPHATYVDLQELRKLSAGLSNLDALFSFEHHPGLGDEDGFGLLRFTDKFLATDPRDYVYGILALSAELRQLVPQPNYANSKGVVFRDLTKAMLAIGYNLDLICYKHPTHVNQFDVASWVPDWDVRTFFIVSPDFLRQAFEKNPSRGAYFADAGKDAIISYIGDGSILRVWGISYDRVDGLGLTYMPGWHFGTENAIEPNHKQNAYGSDLDTFKALKQLSQETFRVLSPQAEQDGYSLNNEYLIPRVSQQIAFMDPNSSNTKSYLPWLQQTKEFSFMGRSLHQWYEMTYIHAQALPLASSSSIVQMDQELDGMLMCLDIVKYNGWRWLSTDRGYLGQTHPQTQKGDEIVIIQGCTVPMVLRPCGQHYNVVCAAYVQGIMHGEALQGVNDDQMRYFDLA